jgi:hypothetical protein
VLERRLLKGVLDEVQRLENAMEKRSVKRGVENLQSGE